MVNPYEPPSPAPPIKSSRTAAFWVLFSVEAVIAIGTIAPCCVVVHFNGLWDVVFFSLGPDHDRNNDGLVTPWEVMGPTLIIAWVAQFLCIGVPSLVSCNGLLCDRDYGWHWAWILTSILAAFSAANVVAVLCLGGGHAMGTPIFIAADFVAVGILLVLLCQPIYRGSRP
jgi:hypothetical protein